jgi:alkylation response protein AidB-like acyl-CoA dehydrogenase
MFFELDENQLELRSVVRSFLTEASPEHGLVRRVEERRTGGSDVDLFRRLCAELDVLGAAVPDERGGSGAGLVELFVVFAELGRVLYGGPFLSSVLAAEVLVSADPEGHSDPSLEALIKGESRGAVAGLSWGQPTGLTASGCGGDLTVSGRSAFVFNAPEASTILLFADAADGLGCFMVKDFESVSRIPIEQLDLTRSAAHLEFHDVAVRRIGTIESATIARTRTLGMAALCIAAEQVGVAERSLEIAVEHAKLRKQFGSPIGSFQAVKHRLADAAVAVESAVNTALHAAWALNGAIEPDQPWASLAKSVCVETSVKVTGNAIQVLGGLGFTWEHPIHLFYRRAIASRQSFGSTRMHRELIASRLLGNG